jgi:hypothetical protein
MFFLNGCSDNSESSEMSKISFNSCNWTVGEEYERIPDETVISSFVSTDDKFRRTIDFYGPDFNLIQQLNSDSFKVNYKKSIRGIDFYEFDNIFSFAGKNMSFNSFAMNKQSGTIVFLFPKKEFLVDFLSQCLTEDEVMSLLN